MIIDKKTATRVLFEEAERAEKSEVSKQWAKRFEQLSELCAETSKTHIAALGTALLAKAVNLDVDVFSLKRQKGGPRAYSARSIAKDVLARHSTPLEIDLGVTGPEPLNNQPYFRENRISREMPVRPNARQALYAVCDILELVDRIETETNARLALRTFIHVRRKHFPQYAPSGGAAESITAKKLTEMVEEFVGEASEGGTRAQAVVTGLLDIFAAPDRVRTDRINDPDRHLPGDVGVQSAVSPEKWERVFEVRDKPVQESDLYHFTRKCAEAVVEKAALLAVATGQEPFHAKEAIAWAAERGVSLSVCFSWAEFIDQLLFWASGAGLDAPPRAAERIYERLVELEISEAGAAKWHAMMSKPSG